MLWDEPVLPTHICRTKLNMVTKAYTVSGSRPDSKCQNSMPETDVARFADTASGIYISCVVASFAKAPKEGTRNRMAYLCKAPVDNIDLRILLFYCHRASKLKPTVSISFFSAAIIYHFLCPRLALLLVVFVGSMV